ncbi:MAG: Fe-S cluster assembly protein SufD [Chloroflexi bacterium]|nr:Fe-S cluster assembly protein SufD [Chloroflexota bacterium]
MPAPSAGLTGEAVEQVGRLMDEPTWAAEARRAGWAAYERIPMPTTAVEEWRRTDLRPLRLSAVIPHAAPEYTARTLADLPVGIRDCFPLSLGEGEGCAGLVVHHNSGAVYAHLDPALAQKGVIFTDLPTALRAYPDLVRRYLFQSVAPDDDKFAALNAARWTTGTFLYVPRGVCVDTPFLATHWADIPRLGIFNRTLVVAEAGSEVTLIEQLGSPTPGSAEGQGLHVGVAESDVQAGARLRHYHFQDWGGHVWGITTQRTRLHRDATANTLHVAFGGRLTRNNIQNLLAEPGATTEMLGILFGDGRQHFDHHTLQDHQAPHTTSDLLYKGALKGRARSVFAGLIRAQRDAQRTDAIQTNRNILLGGEARADSIPTLEIEANDLRCTHAATVAPVDPEQVFYLQARGLDEDEAKRLIVDGFFAPILDRVPLAGVRERLARTIARKAISDRCRL